jgi:hypothetical protein
LPTTSTSGVRATMAMGARSRTGSYGSFARSAGFTL